MRAIGINEFLKREFDSYPFDGIWKESFGEPEKNFKAIVYGESGNGKTDFCIKLAKYISRFARVYYNSFEEGVSKTLQDALIRNNMQEVSGRVVFGNRESFDEMMERLSRRNSPKIVFIDSRDFIDLTTAQFKKITKRFSRKAFIIVCWEKNKKPQGEYAKKIEYISDIKIRVIQYVAYPRCRYGGNKPFVIWGEGAKKTTALTLF